MGSVDFQDKPTVWAVIGVLCTECQGAQMVVFYRLNHFDPDIIK